MERGLFSKVCFSFLVLFFTQSALAQEADVRIGGTVYADMNDNGEQDEFELGLGGIPVELYDEAGETVLASISADIHGDYEFTVAPDRYRVRFSSGSSELGFTDVIDVSAGNDALDIMIGVAPEGFGEPTAVSRTTSKIGLSLDIILFCSFSVFALIAGLFIGRRRGLI